MKEWERNDIKPPDDDAQKWLERWYQANLRLERWEAANSRQQHPADSYKPTPTAGVTALVANAVRTWKQEAQQQKAHHETPPPGNNTPEAENETNDGPRGDDASEKAAPEDYRALYASMDEWERNDISPPGDNAQKWLDRWHVAYSALLGSMIRQSLQRC
jgi:hypothetical protein